MLRPHVLSFLDIASAFQGSDLDLEMEQIRVSERSQVASNTLEQSRMRQTFGVIVLAVIKPDGKMKFNPAGDTLIQAGDVLIAMGERSRLTEMEETLEA
jgi:voltage-gated potassium channel